MTPYDGSSFDPPAPVAYVILQYPTGDAKWPDVPMQIDLNFVTLLLDGPNLHWSEHRSAQ